MELPTGYLNYTTHALCFSTVFCGVFGPLRAICPPRRVLPARKARTASRPGGTRLLQERRTERTTERAALWQLREEYSAPDSAGRQWPTARTLTRAGRSTETDRRTVSADSASRRTAETGRLHEYAYDNHWSEKTDRGEESKQRDASRIPVILSVLAVLAAVYFGVKHYLKKKR